LPAEYYNDVFSLLEELDKNNIQTYLYKALYNQYPQATAQFPRIKIFDSARDLNSDMDFLLSLGGDGTILDAVTLVQNRGIPILGVNFGRLGFLTGTDKENFSLALNELINGNYVIDQRTLLHLDASALLFGDLPFALNDFTITKRDIDPMAKIHTFLNGEYINSYYADGLIVATSTGSTGYSMSCNGPILFPNSANFVITPIAPHHLNTRPLIVPDSSVISFEIDSRSNKIICTLDARHELVESNIQLAVQKENFTIKLVRFKENSFLSTLRNKLSWGIDKRN
jgi:NAD+ kinase